MKPNESDNAPLRAVGVYGRPECIFNYCPNPQGCKERDRCQHPAGGGVLEAGEQSGASEQQPPKGLGAVNGSPVQPRDVVSLPVAQHILKVLVSVAERMSTGDDFRVFEDIQELTETLTVEIVAHGAEPENIRKEPMSERSND